MKKYYKIVPLIIIALIVLPFFAEAAGLVPCGGQDEDPCTLCHLFVMIKGVIDFLTIGVAAPLVVVMGMASAIMFITAHGNPEWITRARQTITAAVIGFLIVLLSWVIINTVVGLTTESGMIFGKPWHTIECGQ
jgi:hypothetical protein